MFCDIFWPLTRFHLTAPHKKEMKEKENMAAGRIVTQPKIRYASWKLLE
jgi:hypothetical protein